MTNSIFFMNKIRKPHSQQLKLFKTLIKKKKYKLKYKKKLYKKKLFGHFTNTILQRTKNNVHLTFLSQKSNQTLYHHTLGRTEYKKAQRKLPLGLEETVMYLTKKLSKNQNIIILNRLRKGRQFIKNLKKHLSKKNFFKIKKITLLNSVHFNGTKKINKRRK